MSDSEARSSSTGTRKTWAGLAAAVAVAVVGWEYSLSALLNPDVSWNLRGVGAHMLLDLAFVFPVALLALHFGLRLARRLGMTPRDTAGVLGTAGVLALLLVAMLLPITSSRDIVHEWVGQTYSLPLAEVQTTVVRSDLTIQESTELCSFGSVRNPSLARDGYQSFALTISARVAAGLQDALIQLVPIVPLLLLGVFFLYRRELPGFDLAPLHALSARVRMPVPMSVAAVSAIALVCASTWGTTSVVAGSAPGGLEGRYNACTDGGAVKTYDVSAIGVTITLNRWGDHVDDAFMYALNARIPEIQAFEAALEADRQLDEDQTPTRVSFGLRKDPIQPLVIRANLGECLEINFTNDLPDGDPASLHILGLAHEVDSAGSAVGDNPNTFADPGETITYRIPLPLDADAERAYYFHDHGAGRRRQNMGLFGAIIAEPAGSIYLDPETGVELDTVTGNNWEAIIVDPALTGRDDEKSFREFAIFYHEIGDEAFTNIKDGDGKLLPLVDDLAGVYRPGARALSYRSEPFRQRIGFDKDINGSEAGHGKSLGYSSYPFGDPATPIPRSYVGEGVKTRLLHGGSEVFHVHHLHGGGDRWRRNPNADQNNDFWKGLTKVPDPNNTSIHLDSQSIGPGTSYNLEHECGAGGCQQGVGEFLYHCHIGHHYLAGMWAFWRVFGTEQTAETNVNGFPLAVIPELFQADNVFANSEAPSNTPPEAGVSAGDLIGLTVDDGRVIVADADVADPDTEIGVLDYITNQLPPAGVRLDNGDATVWDWTSAGDGDTLQIFGEPEETLAFPGWVSENPGERPEVLFNPKNARYTWPLFRPHAAARPPFTARHTGAPWLGEEMKEGRMDGLCAVNGVHPSVDVGNNAKRFYPVSSIMLPIQVSPDAADPEGQIFVLNEQEADIRDGKLPAEPLTVRSNVGDCVEITFTNKIPDSDINKNFSKTNIHSHFVQFDTQASDGVITGFSYEQSVRPIDSENRYLSKKTKKNATEIKVSHTDRLRPGIWIGIGLGEGVCGTNDQGQPTPCTEIRQIVDIQDTTITLDEPLTLKHGKNEAVGVEFVRYNWYSDVDFGTVFFHTHVEFKDWDHGLFGTHVVEPAGSSYHDPTTGKEVRSGTLVDIHVDPTAGGNAVAAGVDGSFREFMLFLQNNNPVEGRFTRGGGTINLRAEPWRVREDSDPAYRFSSVTHGDPHTQIIRAYVGDPIVIRGMGLVEHVGGIRFTGHRFDQERFSAESDTRDGTFLGISERFDFSLEGGAGGTGGFPGDYLYYSTLGKDFESGAWGLLRAYGSSTGDLQALPGLTPNSDIQFPELTANSGSAPPSLADGPGDACPAGATLRSYDIAITDTSIVYNDFTVPDGTGVAYRSVNDNSSSTRSPLVVRANRGECLRLNLRNDRSERSGITVGELPFDPQRSYGAAIGLNHDSTVASGATRSYEWYADAELGITIALNLADPESTERGAFGGVVIEPTGSQFFRPGTTEVLPDGGIGIQADIVTTGETTREFVALFNDQDRRIGQNAMPYPAAIENQAGISYAAEPLSQRDMLGAPSEVFDSSIWGDPRNVVTVPQGTPLTYRVAQPWGNQGHVPTLEGHRWLLDPGMQGSEQMFNDILVPGMSLDLEFVGGAGGDIGAAGDYLFLDRRQPFLEGGLWNILRVTDDGTSGGVDTVTVTDFEFELAALSGLTSVTISGVNSTLPAGDTAGAVTIFEGGQSDDHCAGSQVGSGSVDTGNGKWKVAAMISAAASQVCVESSGGGVTSFAVSETTGPEVDYNNPGVLEPVTSSIEDRDVRIPNTDQSVDGSDQDLIEGGTAGIVREDTTAGGVLSMLGAPIDQVTSPNEDMRLALFGMWMAATAGDQTGVQAASDELKAILYGTTRGRMYDGFGMLNFNRWKAPTEVTAADFPPDAMADEYKMKLAVDTGQTFPSPYDGVDRKIWEVDINLSYYDGQIDSDTFLVRFPFGHHPDDTLNVNYRIFPLVQEDFSPTVVMLDRRKTMRTVNFPFKGLDSVWVAFFPGEVLNLTVKYPPIRQIRGVYTWGWRVHPPRIQFMQPVYEIENAHTNEIELDAQSESFAYRNREELTIDTIGEAAPEKKMLRIVEAVDAGAPPAVIEAYLADSNQGPRGNFIEWAFLATEQRQLPPEAWDVLAQEDGLGLGDFGPYDMVTAYVNNEMYGNGPHLNEIRGWEQYDTLNVKLINLDNHTHYFRNVDFGARLNDDILECCGGGLTSFEIMNFKPTYGGPKVAEMQWRAGWGFRPHYNVIQQQGAFPRGQDRAGLTPWTGGQGGIYYGFQYSEEARGGDFRFNPPPFVIQEADDPAPFPLRDVDGEDGLLIGQRTKGYGTAQTCPQDPYPGFCVDDWAQYNPLGVLNFPPPPLRGEPVFPEDEGKFPGDVYPDVAVELRFPPFLRNPDQGASDAGDIIPPTDVWRTFLWYSPNNGTIWNDPNDPSQGFWADGTMSHGAPVFAGESLDATVEAPRSAAQVFYQFDDLFHDNSIFSPHPVATGDNEEDFRDAILEVDAKASGKKLKVRGELERYSVTGEYATWVSLHAGPANSNGCIGEILALEEVDQKKGRFKFKVKNDVASFSKGEIVCIETVVGSFVETVVR